MYGDNPRYRARPVLDDLIDHFADACVHAALWACVILTNIWVGG